jgi:hypothetical protein
VSTPAIDDALMASVSRDLGVLRSDVCVIRRPLTTRDAGGAPIDGWSSSAPVDCRVDVAGTRPIERVMGGTFAPDADYLISFPVGTDVDNDDQIDARGVTYDVITVLNTTYAFETTAACRTSS